MNKYILVKADLVFHIEDEELKTFTKTMCGIYIRNDQKVTAGKKENPVFVCKWCKNGPQR